MPCRMVVEGELATLHMTLADPSSQDREPAPSAGAGAYEFPGIFEPIDGRETEPERLRKELEDELTDDARRLLASEDVNVTLRWRPGSLEIAALVACGKVVADIGAFLTGVREIRDLFPQRIRERVSAWLGRDLSVRDVRLEAQRGLLRGKAEDASSKADGGRDTRPSSVGELASYAGLSLAVLLLVAAVVIGGSLLLT